MAGASYVLWRKMDLTLGTESHCGVLSRGGRWWDLHFRKVDLTTVQRGWRGASLKGGRQTQRTFSWYPRDYCHIKLHQGGFQFLRVERWDGANEPRNSHLEGCSGRLRLQLRIQALYHYVLHIFYTLWHLDEEKEAAQGWVVKNHLEINLPMWTDKNFKGSKLAKLKGRSPALMTPKGR